MSTFFLQQGLVIQRYGQFLEYTARTLQDLYFEEPTTGERLTLSENQFWAEYQTQRLKIVDAFSSPNILLLPELDQTEQIRSLEDLQPKHQVDVMRKLDYIHFMQKQGITRGQRAYIQMELAKVPFKNDSAPPKASTVQAWWKAYETCGFDAFSVVTKHANKVPRKRIDKDSEVLLQRAIDEKYAILTRPSIAGAYKDYKSMVIEESNVRKRQNLPPLQLASQKTFENRINSRSREEMMVSRHGRQAAKHHFNMIKGHLRTAFPLDLVQIDHTPLNLYVLDDVSYIPLGTPHITALKDGESSCLTGMYVSFRPTGLQSVYGAIKHSLVSHQYIADLWPDIENPWPAHGMAATYWTDRGLDFVSGRLRLAVAGLGAGYEHCPVREPWVKGSIERFFGTIEQTFYELLPGRTFSKLQLRDGYNPKEQAVIRFSTLIYLLHKWAADYHNILENSRSLARPLDLWIEGVGKVPPAYPKSIDQLNVILGHRERGKLSHEGLRYEWMTYANEWLQDLMKDLGKGIHLEYVVNLEDLGRIQVLDPRTKTYHTVPNTRPEYANGLSHYQHKYIRKYAAIALERDSAINTLLDTRNRIAEIAQEELAKKDNATKRHLARVAEINSNAVLGGNPRSISKPFREDQSSSDNKLVPPASFTDVPKFSWGI